MTEVSVCRKDGEWEPRWEGRVLSEPFLEMDRLCSRSPRPESWRGHRLCHFLLSSFCTWGSGQSKRSRSGGAWGAPKQGVPSAEHTSPSASPGAIPPRPSDGHTGRAQEEAGTEGDAGRGAEGSPDCGSRCWELVSGTVSPLTVVDPPEPRHAIQTSAKAHGSVGGAPVSLCQGRWEKEDRLARRGGAQV